LPEYYIENSEIILEEYIINEENKENTTEKLSNETIEIQVPDHKIEEKYNTRFEPDSLVSSWGSIEEQDGPFSINSVLPSSDQPYDKTYKIIIVGDSGVGKTNLLGRWSRNQYTTTTPTLNVTLVEKSFKVNDTIIRVVIWDTAGQENFRSLTRSYYRGSQGAILVFDLSNANSFSKVHEWLADLRDQSENPQIILVGNKNDMPSREISQEEALSVAHKNSLNYMETSAKSGANVNKAFQMLLTDIHKVNGSLIYEPPFTINDSSLVSGSNSIIVLTTEKPPDVVNQKKEGCCS